MEYDGLFERFQEFGDQPAIIGQDRQYSYRQLLDGVMWWRQVLVKQRVEPGRTVALSGDFSPDTITLLLALMANSNIIVPLGPEGGSRRDRCLDIACASTLFAFDERGSWRVHKPYSACDHILLQRLQSRQEAGLIIFSSGSTGDPKASLHSFTKLLHPFKERRRAYRTLTFLRLDHVGGINTLFQMLCYGGTVVNVSRRTVDDILRAIEHHRVQLLPTTPTFLNMLLLSERFATYDLSALEVVSYGAEPMPATTLNALKKILPHVKFRQLYGLTELGILPTKPKSDGSQWLQVGNSGCEAKVVNGLLWIRTETAMLGYLNAPSPFDDEGWFNTGDAVEQQGDYLRILGRESELINVGGEKVFPAEVENIILQMDNIQDASVLGKPNAITGQIVSARVVLIRPEAPHLLEQRLRRFCKERLAPYKVPLTVEVVSAGLYGGRFKKVRRQEEAG